MFSASLSWTRRRDTLISPPMDSSTSEDDISSSSSHHQQLNVSEIPSTRVPQTSLVQEKRTVPSPTRRKIFPTIHRGPLVTHHRISNEFEGAPGDLRLDVVERGDHIPGPPAGKYSQKEEEEEEEEEVDTSSSEQQQGKRIVQLEAELDADELSPPPIRRSSGARPSSGRNKQGIIIPFPSLQPDNKDESHLQNQEPDDAVPSFIGSAPSRSPECQRHGSLPIIPDGPFPTPKHHDATFRRPSILRSKSKYSISLDSIGDIPSLEETVVGVDDGDSLNTGASSQDEFPSAAQYSRLIGRSCSAPPESTSFSEKNISFDHRIWVREFERTQTEQESTWYSNDDMDRFKRHALALVVSSTSCTTTLFPTGTAHVVHQQKKHGSPPRKVIFSNTALAVNGPADASEALKTEQYKQAVLRNEIRNILLVDPHDICLNLFEKTMKALFPDAKSCLATTSEAAFNHISSGLKFDIILVEERLQVFHRQAMDPSKSKESFSSGSELIRVLSRLESNQNVLFIGTSPHIEKDRLRLESSGADLCWSKPPPVIGEKLRNGLLKNLLVKRGRHTTAEKLFGI